MKNSTKRNLVGMVFGKLTVIEESGRDRFQRCIWLCKCSCGNNVRIVGGNLTSGNTSSCGCIKKSGINVHKLNLVGRRFGNLIVLEMIGRNKRKSVMWSCQCDCGNMIKVVGSNLTSGNTKSCGCYKTGRNVETHTTHGISGTAAYYEIKKLVRGMIDIEWSRKIDKLLKQYQCRCVVCGTSNCLSTDHVYPLARGYKLSPGNAVRLCMKCNNYKRDKFPQELNPYKCYKILLAAESFRNYYEKQSGV